MEEFTTKLAVVDDEEILTQLLAKYLSEIDNFEVVLTAFDGSEFLEKLKNSEEIPEIVLLDLRMKKMDGIETINNLKKRYKDMQVIIISNHYKLSFMGYMIKNGISAFIPKGVSLEYIIEVINSVRKRGFYFTDEQINVIRSQIYNNYPEPNFKVVELTEREKKVLELICHQYTCEEIGEQLHLAKRTIEGHRNKILAKTNMKNTAGLVIYAIRNKIIDIDDLGLESILS
jgi:DNA-binding NarL/FixJ family response regulator